MAIEFGTNKEAMLRGESAIKKYMIQNKIENINDEFAGRHVYFEEEGDVMIDGMVSLKELELFIEIIKSMEES